MNQQYLPIINHLLEIKYRCLYIMYSIILTSIISYQYKEEIFYILSKPLGKSFIYTDVIEAFTTYIKMSLMTGIYFSYPILLYHFWSFIIPGLYLFEKKIYRIIILISIFLFLIASTTGYYILFPIAYAFFLDFQRIGPDKVYNIELQAKIHEYLLFNTKLLISLGLCFQLPIIIFFIWNINPRISLWLTKQRRFIYVLSFILAAILSPPDILSQIIIGIPLIIFFEISIFSLKIFNTYAKKLETIGIEPTA